MNEPVTYEIVIRGHASERILARLRDDFSIDTAAGRHTRLVGQVRDASHLHGVIHQLMSLAIEIVSITPLGSEPSQPSNKPKEAS